MSYYHTPFPSSAVLAQLVGKALAEEPGFVNIEILGRKQNPAASTYPIEVVTVRGSENRTLSLFIKYEVSRANAGFSFLKREQFVYEHLLPEVDLDHCRYFGTGQADGSTCLILGYLNEAVTLSKSADPSVSLLRAATWIARFHTRTASHAAKFDSLFPRRTRLHYQETIARSEQRLRHYERSHPWVVGMCRLARKLAERLDRVHETVIHGEYYPNNIIVKDGRIHPVDWELAATGPGALDLAALVAGWPPEVQAACIDRYRAVRKGDADAGSFERDFKAAQLLLQFAWIGSAKFGPFEDRPPWNSDVIGSVEKYYRAAVEARAFV